jgi:hypothetical protein
MSKFSHGNKKVDMPYSKSGRWLEVETLLMSIIACDRVYYSASVASLMYSRAVLSGAVFLRPQYQRGCLMTLATPLDLSSRR